MHRRTFLAASAAAAALGANDRINVAVIGVGGRGTRSHQRPTPKSPDARIAAVCDVDQASVERAVALVEKAQQGSRPKAYTDMRKVLRRQGHRRRLHRHAQPLARAGHHLGLPGGQGRLRRKARLPQHLRGPQDGRGRAQVQAHGAGGHAEPHHRRTRSAPSQLLREGVIGKVYMAKGLCFKRRKSIGHTPDDARAAGRRLGHVPRPGAHAPVQHEPLPLQLALVLGHRQRRHRQPGRARDGHRPLGPGQGRGCPTRVVSDRRQVRLRRRPGDAQHAARHLRLRRLPAGLRGARPADRRRRRHRARTAATSSATSSSAARATWPSTRAASRSTRARSANWRTR